MDKIKLIIVDDINVFRDGIRMNIQMSHPDMVVVGEAKYGADLFHVLETPEGASADIVLLDIVLPDMSGVEIARRLKSEHSNLKILAISDETSSSTVQEMLHIGVEGFISKFHSTNAIIIEAIRTIMAGFEYFGRDISEIISRIYIAKKKQMEVTSDFSEQEKRVIDLCHEGLPAKLIADRLGITSRTVAFHKSNIFRKLGVNSTLELMRYGVKTGIIRVEG